jgi:hypothetical protein
MNSLAAHKGPFARIARCKCTSLVAPFVTSGWESR